MSVKSLLSLFSLYLISSLFFPLSLSSSSHSLFNHFFRCLQSNKEDISEECYQRFQGFEGDLIFLFLLFLILFRLLQDWRVGVAKPPFTGVVLLYHLLGKLSVFLCASRFLLCFFLVLLLIYQQWLDRLVSSLSFQTHYLWVHLSLS